MSLQSDKSNVRRADPKRRGLLAWTLLASLLLLAALAGPSLFGCVYTRDDLGAFHLPIRAFYTQQLVRGEPFDWMPQLFSGFCLAGEGQAGTYHPLHLVLYRFLPLQTALACELLASYPFMLAGMFLFLRRHRLRSGAAMFGGLAFTFSGFNLLHFVHPNAIAVVAHVPWLLWMIDVVLLESSRRRVVGAQAAIALLTGSQLLLGYPQYVWFSLLAEAAYGGFVILQRKQPAEVGHIESSGRTDRIKRHGKRWRFLVIAKAIGLMLGAVQLFPTVDALTDSVRRSPDAAFLSSGSMHPLNLVQLVAPYLFTHRVVGQNTHELGLYLGAVPLMLIVWLLVRRRALGRLRSLAFAAAGFGLLALLLALGKYGHLHHVQRFLPLVGQFRFPCRYTVLFHLSAAVLSAIGIGMLIRQYRRREVTNWRESTPLWAVTVTSVLVATAGLLLRNQPFIAPAPAVLVGPLLIGSAAWLVVMAARGRRWALVGLVLFAAADLGYYGMSHATYPHVERLDAYVARVRTPPPPPGARVLADLMRFDQSGYRTGNQMTLAGWHRADGYAGLEPARRLNYRTLPALRAAGVRWVKRSEATATIEGLRPYDDRWFEVPDPLPRVRLVTAVLPTDDPARDIARIPLHSAALVEEPLELAPGSPGTVDLVDEHPGRLRVRACCLSRQLLVVSESYHSGWTAEVDGRPQPVVRANGDFLGCVIDPGEHDVVLEFRSRSIRLGLLVSCLGLTLVSGLFIGHLARSRFSEVKERMS